ncbi:MAG TPA: NAD(P)/FAD-dependent oxidoreductase [Vicinamibacterales bacterium]|nr:NAD(P)/FAD-dependent oxidoreductase [Vicinamibacterales bacterium]
MSPEPDLDVAVIGGGAAGLATAIFTRGANPTARVAVLEGAKTPGAKILVSGGSRCNVTNVEVTERDFNGGRAPVIRRILRAFPAPVAAAWFRELGVALHEEPNGKLFPDSNRSRDVLDALLRELAQRGATLRSGHRVTGITRGGGTFHVATNHGTLTARAVVLATGGLSLPKTGSDGWGYNAAVALGHTIVPTTPALAPLLLESGDSPHASLSGVSIPARLDVIANGAVAARIAGALLWTHFGVSGPAALDASRHFLRARLEGAAVGMTLSLLPEHSFDSLEAAWVALLRARPRAFIHTIVASMMPAAIAEALLRRAGIAEGTTLAGLTRDARRALVHATVGWPLPVTDSRGYNYAEVTAGGVDLTEIDPSTMASRRCDGLYLVGEILDVDGRLGGFNFQWAWSSAHVAGTAIARAVEAIQ